MAGGIVREAEVPVVPTRRIGVEAESILGQFDGIVGLTLQDPQARHVRQSVGMVRVDPQRRLECGLRLFEFALIEPNIPKGAMRQRIAQVERHRLLSVSEPESLVRFNVLPIVDRRAVVRDGEACVGLRQIRIELDGLGEESTSKIVSGGRVHEQERARERGNHTLR